MALRGIANTRRHSLLFIGPAVIVLLSLSVFPMIFSLNLSLHDWNIIKQGPWKWVGLSNFSKILLHDPYFRTSLWVTLLYLVLTVPAQFMLGLAVALILNEISNGVTGYLRVVLILPAMMTPVVVGIVWRLMYNPDIGMLNYLLSFFGVHPIVWTGTAKTALLSVAMADTWEWTPFMALIMLAGLQSLPREPLEAAIVDGASYFRVLRFVTLPLLQPAMAVAVVIRLVDSFKAFDLIFVLTQGGPGMTTEILNYYTYRNGFKFFHMGYASALSWILIVIVNILATVLLRTIRTRGIYAAGNTK